MKKILIEPEIPWNPQRGDVETPLLKIPDWAECMGNSVQSSINYIASIDSKLKLLDAEHFDTYTYYALLEPWLLKRKLIYQDKNGVYKDPDDQIYTMSNHVNCMNEMLSANKCKYTLTFYGNANLKSLIGHLEKYKRPIVLGTRLTNAGHIIRIVGTIRNDKGIYTHLVVSDPYGEYPWKTDNQKNDGHYKEYPIDVANNLIHKVKITRMVTIDEI